MLPCVAARAARAGLALGARLPCVVVGKKCFCQSCQCGQVSAAAVSCCRASPSPSCSCRSGFRLAHQHGWHAWTAHAHGCRTCSGHHTRSRLACATMSTSRLTSNEAPMHWSGHNLDSGALDSLQSPRFARKMFTNHPCTPSGSACRHSKQLAITQGGCGALEGTQPHPALHLSSQTSRHPCVRAPGPPPYTT